MRKQIDIGTDIATIGIWDPACERFDLGNVSYSRYQAGLEAEALAGGLFFINTFADGGYPATVYVDEHPSAQILRLYTPAEREFLIHCKSGRLVAGGVEDFVHTKKRSTSPNDQFPVPPGRYAIQFLELRDDEFAAHLCAELGKSNYEYYLERVDQLPWGCFVVIGIAVSAVLFFAGFFVLSCAIFTLGLGYAYLHRRRRASDARFHEIAEQVKKISHEFQDHIYILRLAEDSDSLEGGWYDLS